MQSPQTVPTERNSWSARVKTATRTTIHHFGKHAGIGAAVSIAYFDPGNWGVDLQAGSEHGYRLLFVVLLAGIMAIFLQVLASRLGCVTGLGAYRYAGSQGLHPNVLIDLASHCRLLLHSRPKHTMLYRWGLLYPLYVLSEAAIIATDLAELIGSAIALSLLIPRLPIWAGVLITGFDVMFVLAMGDPLQGRPVRFFEYLVAALVLTVLICICVVVGRIDVDWSDAFEGYLPSKFILQNGAVYISTGIIGATIMPHSLFLGSALATQDRVDFKTVVPDKDSLDEDGCSIRRPQFIARCWAFLVESFKTPPRTQNEVKRHSDRENNSYGFVRAHLYHNVTDIVTSLLGFAVLINSAILIVAAATFNYNSSNGNQEPASLFDAFDIIKNSVGTGPAYLFAVALLAAGQSSSLIATVAGQAVSQGFLNFRFVSPALRRLITRTLGLIPSMVVALAVGRRGLDAMLVASQVALSIVLPFITLPLLILTGSKKVMTVRKGDGDEVDYSNGWIMTIIGYSIWLFILIANIYSWYTLAQGDV